MCGIAGWYRRGGVPVQSPAIVAICNTILHRGPDDSGVLTDGDFGFGMRRLSIVDLAGGHQPMTTPDGRFSIVSNGEIYNHVALRDELTRAGYRFSTRSDTETALAAFACWRNDAWARLEGMFAIAMWDHRDRTLTLARDPLGIKPLYVTEQKGGIAFASELKALLALPSHEFDVDDRAVHDFFSFGHVRRPRSIYRQVLTLDPGHFLTIGAKGEAKSQAFWRPRLSEGPKRPEGDWIGEMREILLRTVGSHLQADVPVGSFLSGGIDSSAITAAMMKLTDQPVKAFTIGFPGSKVDETEAARHVARHLGCDHIVQPINIEAATDVLPGVQDCYDEPFADMAAIPTWYVSKLAAQHVKVVLSGEGGDELFAGYKRHRNARNIQRYRPLTRAAAPFASLLSRLPQTSSRRVNTLRQHAQRYREMAGLPDGFGQFFAATQISSSALRRRLYTKEFWEKNEGPDYFGRLEQEYFSGDHGVNGNSLDRFLFADLSLNMPSAMLTRLDRASMAHSLEARVPFLSHRFVDWALTMPVDLKLRGNVGKYVLRRAVADWLPPETLKKPKQGFQMPLADWFAGDFGTFAEEAWNESGAADAGYLAPDAVDALFREHRSGAADHGRMLYAIAMFSCWWSKSTQPAALPRHAYA
jgi:asparagine synthase (glutamine-hydrolysing)